MTCTYYGIVNLVKSKNNGYLIFCKCFGVLCYCNAQLNFYAYKHTHINTQDITFTYIHGLYLVMLKFLWVSEEFKNVELLDNVYY